jgi:hypothetical protein
MHVCPTRTCKTLFIQPAGSARLLTGIRPVNCAFSIYLPLPYCTPSEVAKCLLSLLFRLFFSLKTFWNSKYSLLKWWKQPNLLRIKWDNLRSVQNKALDHNPPPSTQVWVTSKPLKYKRDVEEIFPPSPQNKPCHTSMSFFNTSLNLGSSVDLFSLGSSSS